MIIAMAAGAGPNLNDSGWPKWQIALAVGAPFAIGLAGYWYVRKRNISNKDRKPPEKDNSTDEIIAINVNETELIQDPFERAQQKKNQGNVHFKSGKYDLAIQCYTEAIDVCPLDRTQEIATFYQNRAAAYQQLKSYKQVVEDCTKALDFNSQYAKALCRRAKACEHTGDLKQALEDVTATCILEGFQNQDSLLMADRVLKALGREKAVIAYKNRKPVMPSKHFIKTYFGSFSQDPILVSLKEHEESNGNLYIENQNDNGYSAACQFLLDKEYEQVIPECSVEILEDNRNHKAEALLLRGTFFLLQGLSSQAVKDFSELLLMKEVDVKIKSNALIKRGTLMMQEDKQMEALTDFDLATSIDPNNCDIYHHRGQLYLMLDEVNKSLQDFEQCVSLKPDFPVAHVQKCYTEYRLAITLRNINNVQDSLRSFEKIIKKFPTCAEGYALYGQALTDQQQFEEADQYFQKALDIEPSNANVYVRRGLLQLQWKQDVQEASNLIQKALEVDNKCEAAYETLGTIEIQRGNLIKAIELFKKAIGLAKTELEMAHLYSLLDAAEAQVEVAKKFGLSTTIGS